MRADNARRAGRSVRSVANAAAVPMTALAAVTIAVSATVFHRRTAVRWRKSKSESSDHPTWAAWSNMNASGTSIAAATTPAEQTSSSGARLCACPDVAGEAAGAVATAKLATLAHSSWASWSNAMAVEPLPSSAMVSGMGCS